MPEVKPRSKRSYEAPWGYGRSILGFSEDGCVEVVEIVMQKGQRTRKHYHMEVTEMFYVASGSAKFFIDGVEYPVREGDFMVVHPGERHVIEAREEGSRIIALKIPGKEEDRYFVRD